MTDGAEGEHVQRSSQVRSRGHEVIINIKCKMYTVLLLSEFKFRSLIFACHLANTVTHPHLNGSLRFEENSLQHPCLAVKHFSLVSWRDVFFRSFKNCQLEFSRRKCTTEASPNTSAAQSPPSLSAWMFSRLQLTGVLAQCG